MIRVTCDGCEKPIDRDVDRWFGVDLQEPPPPLPTPEEIMDGEPVMLTSELRINGDHANHFCSPECLSAWAFSQTFEDA